MKVSAITVLIWLALSAVALGQAKVSGEGSSHGAPSKASLSEVRAIVHELEGRADVLRQLLSNHRSLVEQRPDSAEQQAKWEAAVDRLLTRIESAHAAVVETMQRLDKSITGELPTGLAKDVAKAKNEADPERAMAEQLIAQRKAAPARKAKPGKASDKAAEKPAPSNEELDL